MLFKGCNSLVKSKQQRLKTTVRTRTIVRSFSHIKVGSWSQPRSVVQVQYSTKVGVSTTQFLSSPFTLKPTVRNFADLPPHSKLGLPALSPTMETGNLAKWRKKEGDLIKPGEIIAEIETDKATVEWEATDEGYLAKILLPEGSKEITVGQPVAIVVESQDAIAAFKEYKSQGTSAPKPAAAPKAAPQQAAPSAPTPQPSAPTPQPSASAQQTAVDTSKIVPGAPFVSGALPKSGVFASPLAKALASTAGVPLTGVKGSGPGGRVIGEDVVKFSQTTGATVTATPSTESYVDIPNTQIRKITAQRLTMAKQTIPHYYLTIDCNVDNLLKLRSALNDKANGAYKLSVNDFIIKASALSCTKVPEANSSWQENSIRRYNNVDINVAVNTDKGLFTPIVKDADKIGLAAIANTVKDLAEKAKENKLKPEQFTGGTFTISNLGMFGIKQFAAVINPPQACILAVGGADKRVVPNDKPTGPSDQFKVANYMSVTLSCDHRVVDGAVGAKWLNSFREYIEDPTRMLL